MNSFIYFVLDVWRNNLMTSKREKVTHRLIKLPKILLELIVKAVSNLLNSFKYNSAYGWQRNGLAPKRPRMIKNDSFALIKIPEISIQEA